MANKPKKIIVLPAPVHERSGTRWMAEESVRRAEIGFITDRQRRSIDYWWDQECRAHDVPLPRFRERAIKGQWNARREAFWAEVRDDILRQSKYRAVRDQIRELDEVLNLRDRTLTLLLPYQKDGKTVYPVAPNSYEGLVSAFAKLDTLADKKRVTVLSLIEPELKPTEDATQKSTIKPEEHRMLAQQLLAMRFGLKAPKGETVDAHESQSSGKESPQAGKDTGTPKPVK